MPLRELVRRTFVTALLVVLAAGAARAADPPRLPAGSGAPDLTELSLDQLMNVEVESVYGASRYAERGLDAPTRVTVLTAEDIRDHGWQTLSEALREVTGLYVSYDRDYEYLGMRGLGHVDDYNSRVLVLVDEHRTNDNIFEGALIGTDFALDLEQVDRIEVIRGPASALYGSNAVQGVINVVTKQARETGGLRATAGGGSLGTRGGRLAWGGWLPGGATLQLAGSAYTSDGNAHLYFPEYDTPATNHGIADRLDGGQNRRLFAKLGLGDLRIEGVYGRRHKVVPNAAFGSVFDAPGFWTTDTRDWIDVAYRHRFANELELNGRLYYDDYEYEGSYPSDYSGDGTGPVTINRDLDIGRWAGGELNLHRTLFGKDEFVAGGEWRVNTHQDQRNWDVDPYRERYDDEHHSSMWALYAEDAVDLAPRLRLTAGLRHDDYTMFGGSTHPRVGLIWSLRERTAFKLVYGSAFRVPTSYEVYMWGSGEAPHTDLKPETFRTGEAVFESYFARHFHVSASAFLYRGENFIRDEVRDGVDAFWNSGDLRSSGLEAEISGRWHEAELRVGASHVHMRFAADGVANATVAGETRLANSPADLAQAGGKLPLVPGHAWLSADVRAMSTRLDPAGLDVPGVAIVDANLIARWPRPAWQWTLGVRNLLDRGYGDVAGPEIAMTSVPQDRRTFRLRLDVRL